MKIICSECGKEYSDKEKYCIHCGARTADNRYINNNVNRYNYNHNGSSKRNWYITVSIRNWDYFYYCDFYFKYNR